MSTVDTVTEPLAAPPQPPPPLKRGGGRRAPVVGLGLMLQYQAHAAQ